MTQNIFTLDAFYAWLRKQPPDQEYEWKSLTECCVAQYCRAMTGLERPAEKFVYEDICGGLENYFKVGRAQPHTFGAAAARALALLEGKGVE